LNLAFTLSPFEIGYAVGLIESDGSITINSQGRGKPPAPKIQIVTNTQKELIDNVYEVFSRKVKVWKSKTRGKGSFSGSFQPIYEVTIKGFKCKDFLIQILPFLSSKKEVASLVLKYIEDREGVIHLPPKKRRLTKYQRSLIEKIHFLNQIRSGKRKRRGAT